jgi:hypothetical protein
VRLALLKKEDDQLGKERERLEQEKVRVCAALLRTWALNCHRVQARHLREVKRIRDEDASRFRNVRPSPECTHIVLTPPFLHGSVPSLAAATSCSSCSAAVASARSTRCAPLALPHAPLLTRCCGQAYDTHEMRYVACKIHQLVPQWSEERKRNYVRHAVRCLCCGLAFARLLSAVVYRRGSTVF